MEPLPVPGFLLLCRLTGSVDFTVSGLRSVDLGLGLNHGSGTRFWVLVPWLGNCGQVPGSQSRDLGF